MKKPSGRYRLFLIFLLCIIAFFAWRVWQLRYLYFDPYTRDSIANAMESLAQQEGWLLSDLSLLEANCNYQIKLLHRARHSGSDESKCFYLNLNTSEQIPCDAYL